MKKYMLIIVVLLLVVTASQAQNIIGIRAGYSNSSAKINALRDLNIDRYAEPGFHFAAFTEIPLAPGLFFQPELAYNRMGFGGREDVDIRLLGLDIPANARISTRVNYLQMPLQLKYYFGEENARVQPYVHAGPTIAYATSAEIQARARFLLDFNLLREEINMSSDNVNRWEIGGMGGAGVKFNLPGAVNINLGANYYHAFNNWLNDPLIDADIYNRGWQMYAGTTIAMN